jgi:hypothetical protein
VVLMAEAVVKQKQELNYFFKAILDNVEVGLDKLHDKRGTITFTADSCNLMVDKLLENPAFKGYSWEAVRLALPHFLKAILAKDISKEMGLIME